MSKSTVVQNPVRACTEVELGKYKALMTQEEALAAEDATRASRVEEWVQALEEVPPEVLADAREQQRAYKERQAQLHAQSRTGSRRVSREGGSSNGGNRTPNSRVPDGTSPLERGQTQGSQEDVTNFKSTNPQYGSRNRDGVNALLSNMSDGRQSQDQDIVAQDHLSEEGGRRSVELSRNGTQREASQSKRNLKPMTSAELDAAAVVADALRQKLVAAGVYEAFMQVRLCMNNGKNLRKEFETIDVDRDKVISMNEFLFACYAMGTGLRREQIEAIFRVIDDNGNGVVEPDEFIAAFQNSVAEGRTSSTDVKHGSFMSEEADKKKAEGAERRRASEGFSSNQTEKAAAGDMLAERRSSGGPDAVKAAAAPGSGQSAAVLEQPEAPSAATPA
eukprot:CAMPEP_0196724354 /NCGR_PEP_ID=MMETSP1091-20130531/6236_1 /TAXON_ID=302021 /ORGANISM="Rhodomonas sp., Strain CCMP768" /LENGTH=390 /DNA_ID=CAMNT_0042066463 /DNA_START=305 /DNA_END=1477 /DNA_ORIENTATION=-